MMREAGLSGLLGFAVFAVLSVPAAAGPGVTSVQQTQPKSWIPEPKPKPDGGTAIVDPPLSPGVGDRGAGGAGKQGSTRRPTDTVKDLTPLGLEEIPAQIVRALTGRGRSVTCAPVALEQTSPKFLRALVDAYRFDRAKKPEESLKQADAAAKAARAPREKAAAESARYRALARLNDVDAMKASRDALRRAGCGEWM
jgi:hypothetical protein